jgi:hypothetical protein
MRVRVTRLNGYLICECGRGHLHAWIDQKDRHRLSSHLPPGETDPHNFCVFAHEEIEDDKPLLASIGSRWSRTNDQGSWHLGGRVDEEVIPVAEYKTGRVPMGVLGLSIGHGLLPHWPDR